MGAEEAFRFYEAIRHRLPEAAFPSAFARAADLGEIADRYDVFVFDAFGVLNVGDTAIAGARRRIDALREAGKQVIVLTNAASLNRADTVGKFEKFGFDFKAEEIVSSRDAARQAFAATVAASDRWGVITAAGDDCADFPAPLVSLLDDEAAYDAVGGFLFLSTARWTARHQDMLERSIGRRKRPMIVGNPDAVAPRETGNSLEPGFYAHRVADRYDVEVAFHGKPFPSIYDLVEERIGARAVRPRVVMMGDTLHTDVLGAAARGWSSVLVSDHGLFRGLPVGDFIARSGIVPDWVIPAI